MAWVNITKPSTDNWVNTNPVGKEQYDQADLTYDSANTFYDGVNPSAWTDINKPSYGLTWNDLPIAWQDYNNPWGNPTWTNVNKPQ